MQEVTVNADNQTSRRLRISLDGVRILSVPPKSKGKDSRNLPAGDHYMQWVAAGNKGQKYTIVLTLPDGSKPCQVNSSIPPSGINAGECPFEIQ